MTILGPNDLKQIAIPANWDASRLMQTRLASGETFDSVLNRLSATLGALNVSLLNNPLVASLIGTTAEDVMEYPTGVTNGFEPHTEYGVPEGKRANVTGGMLPLNSFDRGLDFTWDFLRHARPSQINVNLESAIADVVDLFERRVLQRLFNSLYEAVGTGKSVPIADAGVADANYIPINNPNRASAFASSHTHLLRLDGITQANLETAITHLWEHGYNAPYDLLIAEADVSSWQNTTNVTGWVRKGDPLITLGATQDVALVGDDYLGVIQTARGSARVRSNARIPTAYWAVYKSFGPGNSRNPLVVRESPQYGYGAVLLPGASIREFPLEKAMLFTEYGVGIADRVAAAIVKNANSSVYTTPTIA